MEYKGLHPRRISRKKKTIGDVLTIAQAAEMLGVGKQTVLGYLGREPGENAPIPFDAWYKLPGGHIRIHLWIINKIQGIDIGQAQGPAPTN